MEIFERNHFLLIYLIYLVVLFHYVRSQENNQPGSSSVKSDDSVHKVVQNSASSLFGSRFRINSTPIELTQKTPRLTTSSKEGSELLKYNLEYVPRTSNMQRYRQTSLRKSLSGVSNINKVNRLKKTKPVLLPTHKNNVSSTWHKFDGAPRNRQNSSNNVYVDLRLKEIPRNLVTRYENIHIQGGIKKQQRETDKTVLRNTVSMIPDRAPGISNTADRREGNVSSYPPLSSRKKASIEGLNENVENETSMTCSCFWSNKKCGCECSDSLTYDDFQELSKSFRPCLNFSFTMSGGHHFSLPPNLFSKIGHVQNVYLKISNATFDYLFDVTPHTSAFKGVSFQNSAVIEVLGVRVRRGWNRTPLEYLKSSDGAGVEIKLEGCGLRRLSSDFTKVADGNVRAVSISDSRLEMIGSGAFANFDELIHFRLPRNRLSSIKRTDLPIEPQHLTEIDLRNNQLQSLEADLFTAMPSLRTISLAGNPLRVLSEETFSSVIGRAQLQGLSDFPLYCDCRLRWLKGSSLIRNDVYEENLKGATCKRPPHLRGTPFKDLSKEHLRC